MTKEANSSAHNERLMVSARIRPVDFSKGAGQKVVAAYDSQTLVFLEPVGIADPEHPFRLTGGSSCSRSNRHNHANLPQTNNNNGLNLNGNGAKNQSQQSNEGKLYEFDHVFDDSTSQEQVYKNTTFPLVQSVLEGFCATVFAYGATGSGKTHTMIGTPTNPGIMARAVDDVFKLCSPTEEKNVDVYLSYLEIYNEHIRDLLKPSPIFLDLREDDDKNVRVQGLSEIKATSTAEVLTLLHRGNKARTMEATAANVTSSRSHAVLQVRVHQESRESGDVTEGKLFLIDLAGSERASNTKNSGIRLREGAHINRSLLALGNCITALASGDGEKYINYRDSKLTRILKAALGGNSKTTMIAHVNPSSFHVEETRNTLLYAQRARAISNRVRKFIYNPSQTEPNFIIQELKNEVKRLQSKLSQRPKSPPTPAPNGLLAPGLPGNRVEGSSSRIGGGKIVDAETEEDYADLHPTMSISPELRREFVGKFHRPDLSGIKKEITSLFEREFKLRNDLLKLDGAMLQSALDCEILRLMVLDWENLKHARDSDSTSESGTDSDPGRNEINSVMSELKTVRAEQQRLLKTRNKVEMDLKDTRSRIYQVEEEASDYLPEIQREILSHLCKLQQDQVQKMSVEIESELKRRGSLLLRCLRQKALGEAIIHRQRHFLKAVAKPKGGFLKYAEGRGGRRSSSHERIDSESFLPRLINPGGSHMGSTGSILQEVKCDVHSPPAGSTDSDDQSHLIHLPPVLSSSNGNLQLDLPLMSNSNSPSNSNGPVTTKYSEFRDGLRKSQHFSSNSLPRSSSEDEVEEVMKERGRRSSKSLSRRGKNKNNRTSSPDLNDIKDEDDDEIEQVLRY